MNIYMSCVGKCCMATKSVLLKMWIRVASPYLHKVKWLDPLIKPIKTRLWNLKSSKKKASFVLTFMQYHHHSFSKMQYLNDLYHNVSNNEPVSCMSLKNIILDLSWNIGTNFYDMTDVDFWYFQYCHRKCVFVLIFMLI